MFYHQKKRKQKKQKNKKEMQPYLANFTKVSVYTSLQSGGISL